jgi:hypothetical protein
MCFSEFAETTMEITWLCTFWDVLPQGIQQQEVTTTGASRRGLYQFMASIFSCHVDMKTQRCTLAQDMSIIPHYVSTILSLLLATASPLSHSSVHHPFLRETFIDLRTSGHASNIPHLSAHCLVQTPAICSPSSQVATTSAISIFGTIYGEISFLCIVRCS